MKKIQTIIINNRSTVYFLCVFCGIMGLLAFATPLEAQDLSKVNSTLTTLTSQGKTNVWAPLKAIIYIICAIVFIAGGITAAVKITNGENDASKKAMGVALGAVAAMAFIYFLDTMFIK